MDVKEALKKVFRALGIEIHRTYDNKEWFLIDKKILVRPSTRAMLKKYDRELVGAEIGVLKGENAEVMIRVLPIKKMYLIDPYTEYGDYHWQKSSMDRNKSIAHERLEKYAIEKVWIEKMSSEAVEDIKERLDFVYIDGNHMYEYVKRDIEDYYPLLKDDGILAGDDFDLGSVAKAVHEFTCDMGLTLYVGKRGRRKSEWWVY